MIVQRARPAANSLRTQAVVARILIELDRYCGKLLFIYAVLAKRKAPLPKGGWQKSLIFDWGIAEGSTYSPKTDANTQQFAAISLRHG